MLAKGRMLPGWPCCCSGMAAEKIVEAGDQTRVIEEVTCQKCQALLVRGGLLDEVQP